MEEMKTLEQHRKKIDFTSQGQHLESMEQLINIISPAINQYSFLPIQRNRNHCSYRSNHPYSHQMWKMLLAQKSQQLDNGKKCYKVVNQNNY